MNPRFQQPEHQAPAEEPLKQRAGRGVVVGQQSPPILQVAEELALEALRVDVDRFGRGFGHPQPLADFRSPPFALLNRRQEGGQFSAGRDGPGQPGQLAVEPFGVALQSFTFTAVRRRLQILDRAGNGPTHDGGL
jgi:hypothetical protein